MKKAKLINFTTQDFVSEKELGFKLYRWDKVKDKYFPNLKANRLQRVVTIKMRNKEGISKLGFLLEYEYEKAHKKLQTIKEIERKDKQDYLIKIFANGSMI